MSFAPFLETLGESLPPPDRRVLVTGCFDLLHRGHLELLGHAARFGRVTVGLNTDASVQALKGPQRPFVPFEERRLLLESLRQVAQVLPLRERRPDALIAELRPAVYVKGSEYRGQLPEQSLLEELGCQLVWVTRSSLSTTQRAREIRKKILGLT